MSWEFGVSEREHFKYGFRIVEWVKKGRRGDREAKEGCAKFGVMSWEFGVD
jgi:hypothetical protein